MKAVIMASMTIVVNILAFFKVVASSQISPHVSFSGGKDNQNFGYANMQVNKKITDCYNGVKLRLKDI